MKAACVLFDLDGTLLNTNDLVLESLQHTVRTHLGIEIEARNLYKYFGQPLVRIMADLNPEKADQMVNTYREYSALKHDEMVRLFPGVPETIRRLKSRQIPIAVVTSKIKSLAVGGLELFQLDKVFDACIGFEDTERHKPEPEPILKALEVLGICPDKRHTVMVGDSPFDIACAHNAGVFGAAVQWSLHPREVLEAYKPDLWLKQFSDILHYI